jgi:cytoskeletal protein CcmA (bactofilin family)
MSDWITDSAANRKKKSYFNGFIDMSGGELTVRHSGATFGGDVSFGSGVDISGDTSTRGDVDLGGTLTVTEDLSAHALVAAQQLTVASDASFAGVNVGGDLNVGGSITSGGGTLELEGLTLTGDLESDASISTVNLNVVSDASFGNDVYINGNLDVAGDVSAGGDLIVHGAGMFTGSTNINRRIAPSGVYLGNNGSVGSQDSIIQVTSTGDHSAIDFTSSAAIGNDHQDFEGRIIYANSTNSSNPYRLYLVPKYSYPYVGLRLDSIPNNLIQARVDGDLHSTRNLDVSGAAVVDGNLTVGNTLTITETGTGTAAGDSSGSILLKRSSNNGRSSIVFDSVNSGDDFAYIEFQDDGGSGNGSANGQLTIGVQNDTSDKDKERIRFDIAGAYAYLQVHDDGAGGNLGSIFSADATSCKGIYPESYNLNTEWNTTLDYYNTSGSDTDRYTMYQYFNHTESDTHDMALVGYNAGSGSGVNPDGNVSYGYMYRSKNAPNKFISFQTRGLRYGDNSVVDGMRLGVNAVPGYTYDFAVGGQSYFGNTLTIEETGTGTAASATGGSITLSHTTSNGTGKNSIVFKSSTNSDNYGYIEFVDDGAGSGAQNGILTIGIQDDTSILGAINNSETLQLTVAGTYATMRGWSDSTGAVKGSIFTTDATEVNGIDSRAYNLNTHWNTTLDYYDTVNYTDRYTMYQYFNHTQNDIHDMALVGYNAGSGSGVNPDGNVSYGYMYRSKNAPNKFISFQTRGLRYGDNSVVDGMRLGVNAVPGYTYDFAVGGKSHFGGDVSFAGSLTVGGAGIFTGESTGYNNTTSPAGIYIGKYVSGSNEYANMQIVSNNVYKKSMIDFTNTGTVDPAGDDNYQNYEGRIAYYGAGGSPSKSFVIHPYGKNGGTLTLTSWGSSAAEATVNGMLTLQGGVRSNIRDYESIWGAQLLCGNDYRSTTTNASTANYLYVDNGFGSNADLLLTGHINSIKTRGYNLYSKGAVQAGVPDQGLCIQTYYYLPEPTKCFRIGLGDRPNFHQFLTTGHVRVGGDLDLCGNLTVAGFLQYSTIETSTLTSTGNLTLQPTGKVHITRSLQVDGSINFNGDFIKADTLISITEPLDISNDGTGPAMIVRQYGSQPVAEFYDDNTLAMRIADDGIVTIPNDVSINGNLNLDTIVKTGSTVTNTPPTALDGGIFNVISTATPNVYTERFNDFTSGCPARIALYVDVSTNPHVKTPSLHLVKISQQDNDNDFNKGLFTEFWQSGANLNKAICEFDVRSRLTTNDITGRVSFRGLLLNAVGGSTNETELAFVAKSNKFKISNVTHRTNWFGIDSEMLLNYDSSVSTKPVILSKSFNDDNLQLTNASTGLFRVDSSYTPTTTDPSFAYNAIPGDFSAGVYVGTHRYYENNNGVDELVTSAEINMVSHTNYEYSGNYFTFWTPRAEHGKGRFAARFISGCNPNGNGDRWFTLQMTEVYGVVQHDMMKCEIDGNDSNAEVTFGADVSAPNLNQSSDLRLKTDIEPIENALDKVCRLRGVSYRLKENYNPESTKSLGMIAQELEQEFPELVSENKGYKHIGYYSFTAALLDSAKELKSRNDALEAKHAAWEARIKVLEAELVTMDTALQALEVT